MVSNSKVTVRGKNKSRVKGHLFVPQAYHSLVPVRLLDTYPYIPMGELEIGL